MDRRNFLKSTCTLCVAVSAGLMLSPLVSCTPLPMYKTVVNDNKIAVPVSQFEKTDFCLIRPASFAWDIGIKKETDGSFSAVLLRCTHADNQLQKTGNKFTCDLHGSKFDLMGNVLNGPAAKPLMKYRTEMSDKYVIIHLK